MTPDRYRSTGSLLTTLALMSFAGLALWDTTGYVDADSFVFPRTIAGLLLVLGLVEIVRWLLKGNLRARAPEPGGSYPRRIGLVVVMLVAALAMPVAGFLLSALVSFMALMAVAMYDPWTPRRLLVYPLAGVGIVIGFYLVFSKVLLVPLPAGPSFWG